MFSAIQSEWMKYKRTSIPWLLFFIPLAVVAIAALYTFPYRIQADAWSHVVGVTNQVWSGVWIPIGFGIISGLSAHLEAEAGEWKVLRSWQVSPTVLYTSKLLVLAIQTLLSTIWLLLLLIVLRWILGIAPAVPLNALVTALAVNWVVSLPLLILSFWLAEIIGWAVAVAFGAGGVLIASIIGGTGAGSGVWTFIPWAWPMRIADVIFMSIEKTVQVQTPTTTIWAILFVSIITSVVFAAMGTVWFNRRELK